MKILEMSNCACKDRVQFLTSVTLPMWYMMSLVKLLSLLDLTEFLILVLILLCLTSILPPSGVRMSKSTNKCKNTSKLFDSSVTQVCLDCFFLICQWKYLLRKGKEEWAYIAFQLMYTWSKETPAIPTTCTFRMSPADQQQFQRS